MPPIKQTCLSVFIIALVFISLKGCVSMSLAAWDRAYEGEREFIAEYRALSANVNEDY